MQYVGGSEVNSSDLVDLGYVSNLLASNLPQATVASTIAAAYTSYVTTAYVNSQDALLATEAFINTQDAGLLQIANLGIANNIAGLQAGGRLPLSIINVASSQRWPKPFVSPTAYNTSTVTATGTEVQLCPVITVPNPGVVYKLFITGTVIASTAANGTAPVINVRLGSTTGPIVATGTGLAEIYPGGQMTQYTTPGSYTFDAPTWANKIDAVVLGGGGGGAEGGGAGGAGHFAETTTTNINPINVTVGAAGVGNTSTTVAGNGTAGTASSASGIGITTITGAGGAAGGGAGGGGGGAGGSPGTVTFDGNSYVGGTGGVGGTFDGGSVQPNASGLGAGGGGGGLTGNFLFGYVSWNGGNGTPGSVWIFAQDTSVSSTPSGQITVVPVPFASQSTITGGTTLYVMLLNGSATTVRPALWITPFPA